MYLPSGRGETAMKLAALRFATVAVGATALPGCSVLYGADFDYPARPPVPEFATVLAQDETSDDDDPMRASIVVVDVGNSSAETLLAFYRDTYQASDGWREDTTREYNNGLCLVSYADDRFYATIEVTPFTGSRVPAGGASYLVVSSRVKGEFVAEPGGERNTCDSSDPWIPVDLG